MKEDQRYQQLIREIGLKEPTAAEQEELYGLAERIGLETLEVDANVLRLLDSQRINKMLLLRDPEFYGTRAPMEYAELAERAAEKELPVSLYLAQTQRYISFSDVDELYGVVKEHGNRIGTITFGHRSSTIGNADLADFPQIQGLKRLSIEGAGALTSWGLPALGRFTELEELKLTSCRGITDMCMGFLERMAGLKFLNLERTGMSDNIFDDIAKIETLEGLSLANTGIRGNGIEKLAANSHLQALNLSHCDLLNDRAVAALADIPRLTALDLSSCREISDEGVAHLKKAQHLQEVVLQHMPGVTERGVNDLARHFGKQLKIYWVKHGGWMPH